MDSCGIKTILKKAPNQSYMRAAMKSRKSLRFNGRGHGAVPQKSKLFN